MEHLGLSQQYPVQVTTTVAPPYSVYLSDYISPESNSLQVLINLLELDRTNLRVKLRVTIEGAGIKLQTNPSYLPPAIVLQGGVPELLTGFDIRGYLNPDHLVFSGISRSEFMQGGKLPEGFYTFTVEVIEYNRSVQVSSPMSGKANAWVMLNDPPLINLPFNGDKVRATDPQNVLFSWTPRHTASPNAAFTTEYEFRMVEMYPGQTNPDVAIRSSNSIYTVTTTQTSLNYGIIEPTLIPGKKYAFRIRAYDTSGRDLFKNQGYSETHVFQYGDACILPTQISAEVLDPNRARFEWEPETVHSGFVLQYRRAGDNHWFEKETLSSSQIIPELSGSTTYEYQIQPQCGTILGEKSPMYTFTTPEVDENAFVCGAPVPEWDMNSNPLQQPLLPLDVIKVGDWDVIVKSIHSNGDGTYAGTGYAAVPYFNLANVRVTWDRILVNEDYRVIAGHIKTVYSTESRFVMELEKEEIPLEENPKEAIEVFNEEEQITEVGEEKSTLDEEEVDHTTSGEEDPLVFEDIPDIPEEEVLTPEESEALALAEKDEDVEGTIEDDLSLENIEGLSRNADYVVINSITNSFKPGYGRMKLSYSIVESPELKHNKIEIFKVEEDKSLTLITTYFDVPSGEKVTFIDSQDEDKEGWSGKGTDLEFITAGQYRVVITATKDESFKNGFEDYEVVEAKVATFPITSEKLKKIFPSTGEDRIKEVVKVINEFSDEFELTTKDKMAHFLAQIGTETAGLEKLTENYNYSAETIFRIFLKVKRTTNQGSPKLTHKYCDLIDGFACSDCTSCPELSGYEGPSLCDETPAFYFPKKTENNTEIPDYEKWDESKDVKEAYVKSSSLFDYVYSCRLGNGAKTTKDGSKYKGVGFIHLTGKGVYKEVSKAWNKEYPNDKKEFHGTDIDLLKTNIEVALKASLIYWKMKKINDQIDGGNKDLLEVSAKVNLGYYNNYIKTTTVNGYDTRKKYYETSKDEL